MQNSSRLPAVIDGLAALAEMLHQEYEQTYAEAAALYARAAACWKDGDRAEYSRIMRECARLLTLADDLDALYWATNRAARDLKGGLAERNGEPE